MEDKEFGDLLRELFARRVREVRVDPLVFDAPIAWMLYRHDRAGPGPELGVEE